MKVMDWISLPRVTFDSELLIGFTITTCMKFRPQVTNQVYSSDTRFRITSSFFSYLPTPPPLASVPNMSIILRQTGSGSSKLFRDQSIDTAAFFLSLPYLQCIIPTSSPSCQILRAPSMQQPFKNPVQPSFCLLCRILHTGI